jgi:hypothetical protein
MKTIPTLLLFLFILLLSCNQSNKSKKQATITSNADYLEIASRNISLKEIPHINKGVLIGDTILLYDDNWKVLKNISTDAESIVDLTAISDNGFIFDTITDQQIKYPFIKIKYSDIDGWVSGKCVYEFIKTDQVSAFKVKDKEYYFTATKNFQNPLNDSTILIGGEDYPILLSNSENTKYELIHLPKPRGGYAPFQYMFIANDDGAFERIQSLVVRNDTFFTHIWRRTQTDTVPYDLYFIRHNDKLMDKIKDRLYPD